MSGSLIIVKHIGAVVVMTLMAASLQHCALLSPDPAAPPPASRMVSAEGTVHPDDVTAAPAAVNHESSLMDDEVLQSYARQDLSIHFKYQREKIPNLPEIEEMQTLAAARIRSHQLMADKIYHLPLERRQVLGPTLLDSSPALKSRLEAVIAEQGRLEVVWNSDRSEVDGRFILPGKALVDAIRESAGLAGDGRQPGALETAEFREASAEQRQRLARERAIEQARENLREKLLAHPVRSNQTLSELVKRDPRMQSRLTNFVRSAPLKSETINPDGSVTVTIEADAGRLMDLLR